MTAAKPKAARAAASNAAAMPITRPAPNHPAGPPPSSQVLVRARLIRIRPNGRADLQIENGELLQVPAAAIDEIDDTVSALEERLVETQTRMAELEAELAALRTDSAIA